MITHIPRSGICDDHRSAEQRDTLTENGHMFRTTWYLISWSPVFHGGERSLDAVERTGITSRKSQQEILKNIYHGVELEYQLTEEASILLKEFRQKGM